MKTWSDRKDRATAWINAFLEGHVAASVVQAKAKRVERPRSRTAHERPSGGEGSRKRAEKTQRKEKQNSGLGTTLHRDP